MSDLYNEFPSWGETGEYPQDGFFYDGGDQVNEKHLDALWNGIEKHIENLNDAISNRVQDLHGDVVLDQGLVASEGSGTREVDVSASTGGAYVDGQYSGSVSAQSTSHTANSGSSTRTDVVYLQQDGSIGKSEGTDSAPAESLKIAEVDIATDDSISAVRNYARDHTHHIASENVPKSSEPGDLWHNITDGRLDIRQNGSWQTIVTEQDDLTISGGDGLKNGNTTDLVGGGNLSLAVEPADFAGHGLEDDGNDDLRIDGNVLGDGITGGDGVNLELDESVIKDGGAKEIDAAEFDGSSGSGGQVLTTDGNAVSWETDIREEEVLAYDFVMG